MQITMSVTKLDKKEGTKTVWVETTNETKVIDKVTYNNITDTDTIKFFRRLGGIETVERGYTARGYKIIKISSTSPNREKKTIRQFEFE